MTAIIDYGVGNLFSLQSSLAAIGETAIITGDPEKILKANRVILPGVGAFGDAAKKLSDSGLDSVIKNVSRTKRRSSAYVWECSFYLTKATNTEDIEDSVLFQGKSWLWKEVFRKI